MMSSQFEQCRLGIDVIDDEHFRLLDELHSLIDLVRNDEPYETAVSQLKIHLRDHFSHENRLMAEMNFPHLQTHLRDHEKLLQLVDKFAAQVRIGTSLAYATMVVENIFADHITNFDSQYVTFLKHKQQTP